jgi:hypothetical protein
MPLQNLTTHNSPLIEIEKEEVKGEEEIRVLLKTQNVSSSSSNECAGPR